MIFQTTKNRFILFSATAGIVIWILTYTILVSFTEISFFLNKLICVLIVLTLWLIKWYRETCQYLHDLKHEARILARLKAVWKYSMTEIFHFVVLISVLLVLMIFIEKFF
jgi:hypothetical protein